MTEEPKRSRRGFAAMDPARQREIASKGGQSVPAEKRSFSQNRDLAAEAGSRGGQNVPAAKRSFSQNHALAAQAGRKGGQESGGNFGHDRGRAVEAGREGGRSGRGSPDEESTPA
jgi:general stress protein YciG